MAPPKKQNGFMFFVTNWRENNQEGRNMTILEAVDRCGDMWAKMTEEQREPFNAGAKEANSQRSANKEQKLNRAQIELAEKELQMKRNIEGIVMNGKNDLENSKFVFCCFNYFTKLHNSDVYVPAEFAACQYSLNDGILSMFSSLINPGPLNMGQSRDAHDHSTTTHLLPLPPKAMGESNMVKLHNNIIEYFGKCQSTRPIVVFTDTETMPIVKSCFSYLASKGKGDSQNSALDRIVVLDLKYLFFVLKREVLDVAGLSNDKINSYVTDSFFQRDFFEYTTDIGCDYHEENDRTKYCTQSMVMRWCYTFSDYMCGDLGVKLVPGRHIPSNVKPNDDKMLSAATSRLSLERLPSIDSFHSLPVNSRRSLENFTDDDFDD